MRLAGWKLVPVMEALCCLLLCGCQGMFGTIPGDHWHVVPGADDPKLNFQSATQISALLVERLKFSNGPVETNSWPDEVEEFCLCKPLGTAEVDIFMAIMPSDNEITFESRYFAGPFKQDPPDAPAVEQDMSRQILEVLKEKYPHSSATRFIAYEGLFGP